MTDRMHDFVSSALIAGIIAAVGIIVTLIFMLVQVHARDFGQWKMVDPTTRDWFQALMQPDNPGMSCCGEADAYWCDDLETESKKGSDGNIYTSNYCRITDDRDDKPLMRRHIDIGTRIEIPKHKIKFSDTDPQQGTKNPTGHSIVFLSRGNYVYCFVYGMLT